MKRWSECVCVCKRGGGTKGALIASTRINLRIVMWWIVRNLWNEPTDHTSNHLYHSTYAKKTKSTLKISLHRHAYFSSIHSNYDKISVWVYILKDAKQNKNTEHNYNGVSSSPTEEILPFSEAQMNLVILW